MAARTGDLETKVKQTYEEVGTDVTSLMDKLGSAHGMIPERALELEVIMRLEDGPKTKEELLAGIEVLEDYVQTELDEYIQAGAVKFSSGRYEITSSQAVGYAKMVDGAQMFKPAGLREHAYYWDLPFDEEDNTVLASSPFLNLNRKLTVTNVLPNGAEEMTYEDGLPAKRLQLALFLLPCRSGQRIDDASIVKISKEVQEALLEQSIREGRTEFVKRTLTVDQLKEKSGLKRLEESLHGKIDHFDVKDMISAQLSNNRIGIPSTPIVTPRVEGLDELGDALSARLKIFRDIADSNGISFSPLPIIDCGRYYSPELDFFHNLAHDKEDWFQYLNSFYKGVENIRTLFPFVQAARNSIDPDDPSMCYDYLRYCHFFKSSGGRFDKGRIIEALRGSGYDTSIYQLVYSRFARESVAAVSFPLSADEIIAQLAMELALYMLKKDTILNGKKEVIDGQTCITSHGLNFNNLEYLVETALTHSYIMDRDPMVVMPNVEELEKISPALLDHLAERATEKGYLEVVEAMARDGLLEVSTVSQYWPKMWAKLEPYFQSMGVPPRCKDIAEHSFKSGNGSERLMEMAGRMGYAEMIEAAWENLYEGKRWLA